MADKPTIIDAVSTVPAAPSSTQNMPIRINNTQMEQVIKEMAAKAVMTAASTPGIKIEDSPVERINPSTFMRDMSQEMERLYQRFDTLKLLAAEINGMSTDEPLPPQVIFKGLTLDFAISKNGAVKDHSVQMQALSCIGDISNLMSNEFGFIIASLRELSRQVADLAQKTNERCVDAFKDWEASNKNKQIVAADGAVQQPVAASGPTEPTPVSLQTR
jgi:hypothetical protein